MPDPNREKDALMTDHLSYTPLSLIDDIINAVNTIIYQALDAIEDGLLNVPPAQIGFKSTTSDGSDATQAARDEIENGVHQLETLLESTVDKSFDKFEIYTLRSILSVPDDLDRWIRLRHYEGLNLPLPTTHPTPESLHQSRRQVHETGKLNLALKAKQARNAALLSQLHTLLSSPASSLAPSSSLPSTSTNPTPTTAPSTGSLAFLTTPPQKGEGDLTQQTHFITTQLPALRTLVSELRPKITALKASGGGGGALGDVDQESKKEQRRAYIESGVRRVVGKGAFGVPHADGDLKAREGERRGREEVEGLEGVVRGMG